MIINHFYLLLPSHTANLLGQSSILRRRQRRRITKRWNFGPRTSICPNCNAIMWIEERIPCSSKINPKYRLCCLNGDIELPLLPPTPEYLDMQLRNQNFKDNIRMYNSSFAMTSMGGKIDYSLMNRAGPYSFRISGENYHRIGSLLPPTGGKGKYIQLYIHDTEHELQNRMGILDQNGGQSTGLIGQLWRH